MDGFALFCRFLLKLQGSYPEQIAISMGIHYPQRKLHNIQPCHMPDITQMSNSTLIQTIIPIYNSVTWQFNWHQTPQSQKSAYSLNQSFTHVIPNCLPLNNAVLSRAGQLKKKIQYI